jgi:hypothetical protein
MKVIARPYSLNKLSMSSSVISANGDSKLSPPRLLLSTFGDAGRRPRFLGGLLHRSRTRREERSSKITTRMTRWPRSRCGCCPLPFVEEDRELLLADQPGQAVGGGHVAGGEEARRWCRFSMSPWAAITAVLVDQEDHLGVRVDPQLRDDLLDLVELLLVHHDIRRRH